MYCTNVRRLNASQSKAVKNFVIRQLNREPSFGVELIQGPPGTGTNLDLCCLAPDHLCLISLQVRYLCLVTTFVKTCYVLSLDRTLKWFCSVVFIYII